MAAIDKFYTTSFQDYQEFLTWTEGKTFTTPRGCKVTISDYIYKWKEEDFFYDGEPQERPIFNTPGYVDNYLYKHCPLLFIQDWLKDRYSGQGYCKGSPDEILCNPVLPDFSPCKKVKVLKKGLGNVPYGCWWVDIYDAERNSCWYNENHDFWILPGEDDEWTCSTFYTKKTVKSIIRKILTKWKIPAGYTVEISGRFINDIWILKTK